MALSCRISIAAIAQGAADAPEFAGVGRMPAAGIGVGAGEGPLGERIWAIMSAEDAVVIFARAPLPGQTKTRLIPALGPEGAAELYRCFVLDILRRAAALSAAIIVAVAEEGHTQQVGALVEEACPEADLIPQSGRDLGERMAAAFREALGRGHARAVLIGTDAPSLPVGRITEALSHLQDRDLVLGPCLDGGYYLIGLCRPLPEVFQGVSWGTDAVLEETVRRARAAGVPVSLLEPWYDVDTPEDLAVLRAQLGALALADQAMPCPATWRWLQQRFPEQ